MHGGLGALAQLSVPACSNRIPEQRVKEVLEEVGLVDVARRRIGESLLRVRPRLGVESPLLGDPPVLLFDEPLNGLDPEGVKWVRELFRHLAAEGRTAFVASHLMPEMEHTADRLIVIGRGELIAAESLAKFRARHPSGACRSTRGRRRSPCGTSWRRRARRWTRPATV
ncbi:hypothetical protein [Streptomyces sp. NBC_00250]|uniref:hypothetical protein n=1 Tax=Streptomyces sp. NBC_00250 TaxID=2903641 RepID=UPI003FA79572